MGVREGGSEGGFRHAIYLPTTDPCGTSIVGKLLATCSRLKSDCSSIDRSPEVTASAVASAVAASARSDSTLAFRASFDAASAAIRFSTSLESSSRPALIVVRASIWSLRPCILSSCILSTSAVLLTRVLSSASSSVFWIFKMPSDLSEQRNA